MFVKTKVLSSTKNDLVLRGLRYLRVQIFLSKSWRTMYMLICNYIIDVAYLASQQLPQVDPTRAPWIRLLQRSRNPRRNLSGSYQWTRWRHLCKWQVHVTNITFNKLLIYSGKKQRSGEYFHLRSSYIDTDSLIQLNL